MCMIIITHKYTHTHKRARARTFKTRDLRDIGVQNVYISAVSLSFNKQQLMLCNKLYDVTCTVYSSNGFKSVMSHCWLSITSTTPSCASGQV